MYELRSVESAYFVPPQIQYQSQALSSSPAPKGYPNGILMGGLCRSEVDKMVDVNVPLTMNYRGVNISNHKDQGHYRCLPRAMMGGPGHHRFT